MVLMFLEVTRAKSIENKSSDPYFGDAPWIVRQDTSASFSCPWKFNFSVFSLLVRFKLKCWTFCYTKQSYKSIKKQSVVVKNFESSLNHLWIDFESTLNRFCNDFESTLNRLWINCESTLNQHWINFESTLNQWEACRINLTNFWWEFVEKLLDNNSHWTFSKILSNIRWTCKACTKPMCHGYLDNASWFFVIQFQDFMLVVPKFPVLFQSPFHTWLFQKLAKAYVWGELEEIRGKKSTTPPRGRGEARFYRIWCFRWKFGKNERVQTTSILCFNVLFFSTSFLCFTFWQNKPLKRNH